MKTAAHPTRYTRRQALDVFLGHVAAWANDINPELREDIEQEMYLGVMEAHPRSGRATLSYYRTAMRNRAVDFLRRDARARRNLHLRNPAALAEFLAQHPKLHRHAS